MNCYQVREGKGSHTIWCNSYNNRIASIPNRSGKDIKKGTLNSILKALGIDKNQFFNK